MAKKRKVSSRPENGAGGPNMDVGASRKRIKSFEDVAGSDDDFHLNRDRVLLDEGPEAKRMRKWQEQEEFLEPSDEEVLGYDDEEDDDDDDEQVDAIAANESLDYDDDDSDENARSAKDVDVEEGVGWGMNNDEIYGADEIETEEQALEEEKEALRLQKKQLQALSAADYGFDEDDWRDDEDEVEDPAKKSQVVTEVLPQLQIRDDMGPAERLKLLKSRYPEFEPLSQDLLRVQEEHNTLFKDQQRRREITAQDEAPNLTTKLRATSAYSGALLMYFALLSSPAMRDGSGAVAMSATQLRDHPVMDALVKCRDLWQRTRTLPSDLEPKSFLPAAESSDLYDDGNMVASDMQRRNTEHTTQKKSRAQRHAEAVQKAADEQRAERMRKVEDDLANLDGLIKPSRRPQLDRNKALAKARNEDDSSAGEEAALTAQEAADKAKRKKSLRFYASQITQKANKRGAAGRNAGGDDDIPYRERLKDRQARLNAEAEKRGQRTAPTGAELDGDSDNEEDLQQARDIRDADGEDYYDLIASRTARRKAEKSALAAAQKQAAMEGGRVVPEETLGPDGKRKITYAIEKNKGLAPRRKKEVRNPRVKKRKKYDEKKKKLGSVKQIWKGGEGRGGYGGELTGIKTGLVKSVKL